MHHNGARLDLTAILYDVSRSLGSIDARLQAGDQLHQELREWRRTMDLSVAGINSRLQAVEMEIKSPRPSRSSSMEHMLGILKELRPILFVSAAALGKTLGLGAPFLRAIVEQVLK